MACPDGWWEHVLPQGQLAERLRRAHQPPLTTVGHKNRGKHTARKSDLYLPAVAFPTSTVGTTASSSDEESLEINDPLARFYRHGLQNQMGGSCSRPLGAQQLRRMRTQSAMGYYSQADFASAMAHLKAQKSQQADLEETHGRQPFRINGHHFLSLSATTEYSSEEDIGHSSSDLTRSQSGQMTSNHSYHMNSRSVRATSTSTYVRRPTVSIHGLTEHSWNVIVSGQATGRRLPVHPGNNGRGSVRRVSFDIDAEAKARFNEEEEAQRQQPLRYVAVHQLTGQRSNHPHTLKSTTKHTPMDDLAASGSQHCFNTTSFANPRRRRTRTLSKDGCAWHGQGAKPPSRTGSALSASASPCSSVYMSGSQWAQMMQAHGVDGDVRAQHHQRQHAAHPRAPLAPPTKASSPQEVAVLRSLYSAQQHISRTTAVALTYSKSILAVPAPVLRPLAQFTVLWWVSSATVLALATCLIASYMLTIWDDIRGRKSPVLSPVVDDDARASSDATRTSSTPSSSSAGCSRRSSAIGFTASLALDSLVLNSLHYAAKVPIAVAKSLTPRAVPTPAASRWGSICDTVSGAEHDDDGCSSTPRAFVTSTSSSASTSSSVSRRRKPGPLPTRPPLTSLISSMLLTLVIALGDGLVGAWAKRRSSGDDGKPVVSPSPMAASSPLTRGGGFGFGLGFGDPTNSHEHGKGQQNRSSFFKGGPDGVSLGVRMPASAAAAALVDLRGQVNTSDEADDMDED